MNEISARKQLLGPLLDDVREIVAGSAERAEKLFLVCSLLKDNVPHYDWVGFYLVDRGSEGELVLGPFAGEPTEHVRIPCGKGICGQAAQRGSTFIVPDVTREKNYLSCSPKVQAEIVVPIFQAKEVVGELDVDSHALSPFTAEDREFLEGVGEIVSGLF